MSFDWLIFDWWMDGFSVVQFQRSHIGQPYVWSVVGSVSVHLQSAGRRTGSWRDNVVVWRVHETCVAARCFEWRHREIPYWHRVPGDLRLTLTHSVCYVLARLITLTCSQHPHDIVMRAAAKRKGEIRRSWWPLYRCVIRYIAACSELDSEGDSVHGTT